MSRLARPFLSATVFEALTMDYAKVYRAGTLTVSNRTDTAVPFTTATHDPDGYWDSSTKLVVPSGKDGLFLIFANIFSNTQPGTDGNLWIDINNGGEPAVSTNTDGIVTFIAQSEQTPGYGLGWMGPAPRLAELAAGDYVRLMIWQDSNPAGSSMDFLYATLTLLRLSS